MNFDKVLHRSQFSTAGVTAVFDLNWQAPKAAFENQINLLPKLDLVNFAV